MEQHAGREFAFQIERAFDGPHLLDTCVAVKLSQQLLLQRAPTDTVFGQGCATHGDRTAGDLEDRLATEPHVISVPRDDIRMKIAVRDMAPDRVVATRHRPGGVSLARKNLGDSTLDARTVTPVVDFEITRRLPDLTVPDAAVAVVLFRLHGRPLGWGASRVTDGRLHGLALVRRFLHEHSWSCALPLAERAIQSGRPLRLPDAGPLLHSPQLIATSGPLVTVAVRSRTPANRLQPCLDSLLRIDYPSLDLLLVDASDDRRHVEALVREHYPRVRYCSAPGIGTATRLAVAECRGDILAVTDGDAIVEPPWVSTLVHVFLADPDVMTVSGLVVPHSLQRPFRPVLPAGAPFCRQWWRVREDIDAIGGETQRSLERASSNVAYWRPATVMPPRYTSVWEPAAIVRSAGVVPTPHPLTTPAFGRVLERAIDLADGVTSVPESASFDRLRLHVSWAGDPLGTVQIVHHGAVVSRLWIEDAIAHQLTAAILDAGMRLGAETSKAILTADLVRYILSRWEPAIRGTSTVPTVRSAA